MLLKYQNVLLFIQNTILYQNMLQFKKPTGLLSQVENNFFLNLCHIWTMTQNIGENQIWKNLRIKRLDICQVHTITYQRVTLQ